MFTLIPTVPAMNAAIDYLEECFDGADITLCEVTETEDSIFATFTAKHPKDFLPRAGLIRGFIGDSNTWSFVLYSPDLENTPKP